LELDLTKAAFTEEAVATCDDVLLRAIRSVIQHRALTCGELRSLFVKYYHRYYATLPGCSYTGGALERAIGHCVDSDMALLFNETVSVSWRKFKTIMQDVFELTIGDVVITTYNSTASHHIHIRP
jgi:hypothetical protein